jgi:multicomponent Na+:H+ antiporter subunit E
VKDTHLPVDVGDVLVPVVDTAATRRTVEDAADHVAADATLHLVALAGADDGPTGATGRLATVRRVAGRIRTSKDHTGRVAGAGRVVDAQWPTETDLADVLAAYARERGIAHVLVPKDVEQAFPGVESRALVSALRDAGLTEARLCPTGPAVLHRALLVARSLASTAVLFVVSLAFYLLLAGTVDAFEVVTGVATAAVVATVFGRITFVRPPALGRSTARVVRWCLYVPYLLWEVVKANVAIAVIVLHPRLPIDPQLVSYQTDLDGELALTTFANSVTLTPGTLTVDVDADEGRLLVHTLTTDSRDDLFDGSLERGVRFIFGEDAEEAPTGPRPTPGATGGSDD